MRKWVDKYLTELADLDSNVRLIIADVGDFPKFSNAHPDKFLNVGVSESNAIGIAGGLASEGKNVFVYGVSSFFLYRAYEQFKYCIAYWCQRITFIGVGFGWKYYNIGTGHFCPDDIQLVRALPNFECLTPYKLSQLRNFLFECHSGPVYLRLTANIVSENESLIIDGENELPKDLMVTYGEMVDTCIKVCCEFDNIEIMAFDRISSDIIYQMQSYVRNRIFVVEDQWQLGGIAPILLYNNIKIYKHLHLPLITNKIGESREHLTHLYGLDFQTIYNTIKSSR